MNFYILTSKISHKSFVKFLVFLPILYIIVIFLFNYIIDPYGITNQNLLNIKYKLTRDDRIDKIYGVKDFNSLDTILLGSSRVYSINPRELVKYFKGKNNYNFAIGGSYIEDHLGALIYLKKINKLPRNIILGVDFSGFNSIIPMNKYFLKSKELNFLNSSYSNNSTLKEHINKFLTIDATRASFKTLSNHLKKEKRKPRFDKSGLYFAADIKRNNFNILKNDNANIFRDFYRNGNYPYLDRRRISFFEKFVEICKKEGINLVVYSSPMYIENYKQVLSHKILSKRLVEFQSYFSKYNNYKNLIKNDSFSNNSFNFHDRVHTTTNAGNEILELVLNKM